MSPLELALSQPGRRQGEAQIQRAADLGLQGVAATDILDGGDLAGRPGRGSGLGLADLLGCGCWPTAAHGRGWKEVPGGPERAVLSR